MRVLVADDELPARRRLVRMLTGLDGAEVVAEVGAGPDVEREAARTDPDLLLLDIEMPGVRGLELARLLGRPVVFVTAHHEHALAAFDLEAVDYLLKPVSPERLAEALRRARVRIASTPASDDAARVITHSSGRSRLFDARDIDRFWSLDGYTAFEHGGAEHLTLEPLSSLEGRLAPFDFVRVHRAHLVRRAAIRSIAAEEGGTVAELRCGVRVPVARREVQRLKRQLGL